MFMPAHIEVRVAKVPGPVQQIALNGSRTVQDAVQAAGYSTTGYEIRVNGNKASASQNLENGDNVVLLQAIRGNAS